MGKHTGVRIGRQVGAAPNQLQGVTPDGTAEVGDTYCRNCDRRITARVTEDVTVVWVHAATGRQACGDA